MRDASWLHDDVYEVLERHGAALCIHDLLDHHPWVRTTDWTYVRFHGPDALTRSTSVATAAVGSGARPSASPSGPTQGVDAYVYFNNDYGGAAVADATWFRSGSGPLLDLVPQALQRPRVPARATPDR